MSDPILLKVLHLDKQAQDALHELFSHSVRRIWIEGMSSVLGSELYRARQLRFSCGDTQWLEVSTCRQAFQDGFSFGRLDCNLRADVRPDEDTSCWLELPSDSYLKSIEIYQQQERFDIVASKLQMPSEAFNYDALILLRFDQGPGLMIGIEQDFIDGELIVLLSDDPDSQIGENLHLRRQLNARDETS
ncbi:hypothetical protein [Aliamphritea ceti]|uniref:hypothetical protein n=1 Tax=Aliamphritea ceti TaxID=1524258 RepID=UPI0021C28A4B|nr:hypothetical protein [Aliamphritea ceti]